MSRPPIPGTAVQRRGPGRKLGAGAIGAIATGLLGCGSPSGETYRFVDMLDCKLNRLGHLHVHKSREDNKATIITNYDPSAPDHKAAIHKGTKSVGTLRSVREEKPSNNDSNDSRYEVELFLKRDSFGENQDESVAFRFEPSGGRVVVLGRSGPGMGWGQSRERQLDEGFCLKR